LVCTDLKVTLKDIASIDTKQATAFIHDLISKLEGVGNVDLKPEPPRICLSSSISLQMR
jgi:hypothetical protein